MLALIFNQQLFHLTKNHKGPLRLVIGLSVKVWSLRLSDLYLREVWPENHSFSFSFILKYVLTLPPLFNSTCIPEYYAILHFISQLFFYFSISFLSLYILFFLSSFLLKCCGSIFFQNNPSKEESLHFLTFLLFATPPT